MSSVVFLSNSYLPFPRIQYSFFRLYFNDKKEKLLFRLCFTTLLWFFIFADYILRSCFCARDPGNDNRRSLMEGATMSALKVHYVTAIPREINVKTYPTQSHITSNPSFSTLNRPRFSIFQYLPYRFSLNLRNNLYKCCILFLHCTNTRYSETVSKRSTVLHHQSNDEQR